MTLELSAELAVVTVGGTLDSNYFTALFLRSPYGLVPSVQL